MVARYRLVLRCVIITVFKCRLFEQETSGHDHETLQINIHTYNKPSPELKTALIVAQNTTFEQYTNNLSANDNTLWRATKKHMCCVPVPPIRKGNDEWTPL